MSYEVTVTQRLCYCHVCSYIYTVYIYIYIYTCRCYRTFLLCFILYFRTIFKFLTSLGGLYMEGRNLGILRWFVKLVKRLYWPAGMTGSVVISNTTFPLGIFSNQWTAAFGEPMGLIERWCDPFCPAHPYMVLTRSFLLRRIHADNVIASFFIASILLPSNSMCPWPFVNSMPFWHLGLYVDWENFPTSLPTTPSGDSLITCLSRMLSNV